MPVTTRITALVKTSHYTGLATMMRTLMSTPVIVRLEDDNSETIVKSFWSSLNRYQDSLQVLGETYPYTSVVMNVKLPNGDYRLRVLDSRIESDGDFPTC